MQLPSGFCGFILSVIAIHVVVHEQTDAADDRQAVINDLVAIVNAGLNVDAKPCDNFYAYVCGSRERKMTKRGKSAFTSLWDYAEEEFKKEVKQIINSPNEKQPLPNVLNAVKEYTTDCNAFKDGIKDKSALATLRKYIDSFPSDTMQIFLRTLLHLSVTLIGSYDLPFYDYNDNYSTFILHLGLSNEYIDNEFIDFLDSSKRRNNARGSGNEVILEQKTLPFLLEHLSSRAGGGAKVAQDEVGKFNARFVQVLANHSSSILTILYTRRQYVIFAATAKKKVITVPVNKLENDIFKRALKAELQQFGIIGKTDTENINVLANQQLISELVALFQSEPNAARALFIHLALLDMPLSTLAVVFHDLKYEFDDLDIMCDLDDTGSVPGLNIWKHETFKQFFFNTVVIPSRAEVDLFFKSIVKQISKQYNASTWFRNNSAMVQAVDTALASAKTIVGFPEYYFDNAEDVKQVLLSFGGFSSRQDDLYSKEIELRKMDFRLFKTRRKLEEFFSPSEIWTFNAYSENYDYARTKLNLNLATILPPAYHAQYPSSYSYGFMGSIIGEGVISNRDLKRVPVAVGDQKEYINIFEMPELNPSLNCYEKFYNNMCYDFINETRQANRYCANGTTYLRNNLVVNEGARGAFAAMECKLKDVGLNVVPLPEQFPQWTHGQLFFIGIGERWCEESAKNEPDYNDYWRHHYRDKYDNPNMVILNGLVSQMSEFTTAFQCKPGDKMFSSDEQRCEIFPDLKGKNCEIKKD